MKLIVAATAALALLAPAAARGEVMAAGENGFHIRHSVNLAAANREAWDAFRRVGEWWSNGHTYSGKAANMTLSLSPGGCFCERLSDGGGVEHMRVAFVAPGKRAVLTGSLGPLLFEATAGVMDVQIEGAGNGSTLTLDYKVAGFATGGAEKLAPLVDQVLAEQVKRLRTFAPTVARRR